MMTSWKRIDRGAINNEKVAPLELDLATSRGGGEQANLAKSSLVDLSTLAGF